MHYGLNLPNGGADPATLAEFAFLAEQSGWDGVFLEDYIVWQGDQTTPTYDPWVLLAAMAVRTQRIRLGTLVTPLARRRPWKLAQELVTLDHLSGGRMILGVGLGDNISTDISFGCFGEEMDMKRRARMLDEALAVITGLWRARPFSFQGEFYQVKEMTLLPAPVQTPRIPIWIGGAYPLKGPVQRAARWDGACLYRHKTHFMQPEDVRALKALAQERQPGRKEYDIAVGGNPRFDSLDEQRGYMRSLAEAGVTWWMEYVPPADIETMRAGITCGPLRID
ncbi:MAG: LLM class flavin-dependent oxidoreductase [Chloroflexota bacterium]